MTPAEFDYDLPPTAIAQTPAEPRDGSRLLAIDRAARAWGDRHFGELPELLRPGDCLVVNDSRVVPARVLAEDAMGRTVELLFLDNPDGPAARALVKPGRRCQVGTELSVGGDGGVRLRVAGVEADGIRRVERRDGTIGDLVSTHGLPPLPPYITHHRKPAPDDWDRYQTVYARAPGSIAAPTAGLHFTEAILDRVRARGLEVLAVTLHVGLATFRPIRAATLDGHRLPAERVTIPVRVAQAITAARADGRRVVAVGTTVTRALEGVSRARGGVEPFDGEVDLVIVPGHRFRVVDALVTNFHLPRSSLLVLVAAFAGRELVLAAYAHAARAGYRFYSYGDATLIE